MTTQTILSVVTARNIPEGLNLWSCIEKVRTERNFVQTVSAIEAARRIARNLALAGVEFQVRVEGPCANYVWTHLDAYMTVRRTGENVEMPRIRGYIMTSCQTGMDAAEKRFANLEID